MPQLNGLIPNELMIIEGKIREYEVAQSELISLKDSKDVYQIKGSGNVFFRTSLPDAKRQVNSELEKAIQDRAKLLRPKN